MFECGGVSGVPASPASPASRLPEIRRQRGPCAKFIRQSPAAFYFAVSLLSVLSIGARALTVAQEALSAAMALKTSYPPAFHHAALTQTLTASAAQEQLAAFLAKTETSPFLHPDALLSPHGISYAAQSGPTGGLAIHHLRRIAAGLRGENLIAETAEELAQFGAAADEAELPTGDDSRVDALIAAGDDVRRKKNSDKVTQWAEASTGTAFNEEGMDLDDYQLEQQPLEGEVGEKEGAPVVQQNGAPPNIVHDSSASKRPLTEKEKAARREAKKARQKAGRVEKNRHGASAS